jgi:hypothetical protein
MFKQGLIGFVFALLLLQTAAYSAGHQSTKIVERSSSSADPGPEVERTTTYDKVTSVNLDQLGLVCLRCNF